MTTKLVERKDFKLDGDSVTHIPSGKWYSAYPGCGISRKRTSSMLATTKNMRSKRWPRKSWRKDSRRGSARIARSFGHTETAIAISAAVT